MKDMKDMKDMRDIRDMRDMKGMRDMKDMKNMKNMKRIKNFGLAVICAAVLAGCQSQQAETADYIGIEAAKVAAAGFAGIETDQADFTTVGLDSRNGIFFYQINFSADGVEYEYAVDAMTGVVIEARSSAESETEETGGGSLAAAGTGGEESVSSAGASEEGSSAAGNSGGEVEPTQGSGMIGEARAKEIALSHAGLTEEQTRLIEIKRDYGDGRAIYEVEFYGVGMNEYDYEIDAVTGEIMAFDSELHDEESYVPSENQSPVSEEKAQAAVLERVPGASTENLFLHLERDDGRLIYEGELLYDHMEYEFKIDAYSGAVIEWEAERVRMRK